MLQIASRVWPTRTEYGFVAVILRRQCNREHGSLVLGYARGRMQT